ncbi:MAG: hypothetical protein HKN84_03045 [Gammaproteobacteria bacterium]|nr:hypothetical protein [Gammaproteobacteria bacterium]
MKLDRRIRRVLSALVAAVLVLTAGWRFALAQDSGERAYIEPGTSVYLLMVALIDHSAHRIWEAGYEDVITGREWQTLEKYAVQLVASGTVLSLGGTGVADPGRVAAPAWRRFSEDMTDAASAALLAIQEQDQRALEDADVAILEACEACHAVFKPEAPTEGISHIPHYDYF